MSKAGKKRDDLLNEIYGDDNSIYEDVQDYMDYVYRVIDDFEKGKEDKYLSRLEKYQLAQSENNRNHNSVSMERELINIVKTGDLNALKKMYSDKEMFVDFST
ncbi:MAG: hypothetical protein II765_04185, partial [Lachnospiraceae bacterium]|nr:hypothetical protein [Lachnospiraceae bacterium]